MHYINRLTPLLLLFYYYYMICMYICIYIANKHPKKIAQCFQDYLPYISGFPVFFPKNLWSNDWMIWGAPHDLGNLHIYIL